MARETANLKLWKIKMSEFKEELYRITIRSLFKRIVEMREEIGRIIEQAKTEVQIATEIFPKAMEILKEEVENSELPDELKMVLKEMWGIVHIVNMVRPNVAEDLSS